MIIKGRSRHMRHVSRTQRTLFFRLIVPGRTFFLGGVRVWRSRRGLGSRRLCGRRRKPRLEPDVRSSRCVIIRQIPNATPFRVATFTRTTPPFHKMPNTTPLGRLPTGTIIWKIGVRTGIECSKASIWIRIFQ